MLKTNHLLLAQASYESAIEGVRVYCALCEGFDWEHAEMVRNTLFAYLEVALDEVSHAHKMRELSDG